MTGQMTGRAGGGTGNALDPASLAALAPGRARDLAPGEPLFRQGDPAAAVYVVERGRVRLVRHLADGSVVALHTARAGEAFAEASLWAQAYHCDAVAEVPSRILVLERRDLLRRLEADPAACLAFARLMADQVRGLRARLEIRTIRSAPERVLAWLRLQASGAPPAVPVDRPWTEIAEEIGLTREAVYRALSRLQATGRIRRRPGRILISPAEV